MSYRKENTMAEELTLYTGKLNYKDIDFTFVFDGNELKLIPPKEKEHEIEWEWGWTTLESGAKTWADPIPVGVDQMIGKCNETRHRVVFLPKTGATLGLYNYVIRIPLSAYVIYKYDRDSVDRISVSCPEINYIHPENQGITLSFPSTEDQDTGVFSVSTPEYGQTTTEEQVFIVDGKEVKAYFGITRTVSTSIHTPPLRMNSSLMFEFDPIEDYQFIFHLWRVARDFIRFLCYRKNIFIPQIELAAPYEGGKHESFATMYLLGQNGESESEALKQGRFIKQSRISGHEGEILSDIANDCLYLRHLPETYESGRHIDAARFVMITAAFEWEFRKLYPEGVSKKDATIRAEEAVAQCIQEHIDQSSGKQKEIFKLLKKNISFSPLHAEITQTGKDLSGIVGAFGNRLYRINGEELIYTEMGQRLAQQRNNFAHGNLDKDFKGSSLLDLVFMEYILYAMQLKRYGIKDMDIQKAINDLFHLSFAL